MRWSSGSKTRAGNYSGSNNQHLADFDTWIVSREDLLSSVSALFEDLVKRHG